MDVKELKAKLKAAKADIEAYKAGRHSAAITAVEAKSFGQLEQKACSKWRVKSLNDLIRVNTGSKEFRHIAPEGKALVRDIKESVDVALMCATYFKKPVQDTKAYHDLVVPAIKAFGIDSGDAGFEWIPTLVAESYIDEYNLERRISALFAEVKMPSNPFNMPVLSNGAVATILGEATEKSTKDTFSTSAVQLDAVKLSNQYALPEELQEDSAVDVMKVIRQELIEGQEKALEIAILEGDTAMTHQHTNSQFGAGAPAADSSERAFDGLRKRALAAAAAKVNAAATLNESHLRSARKAMGKFGVNVGDLAWICGPKGQNEFMDLDDIRTLEQYGPQAPVLTGEVAKYEGIPVVVSEWLREDTDATGVNGASGNTKLTVLLVNRKRFMVGLRRAVKIAVTQYRTAFDLWDMVSFSRYAFNGVLKADGSNYATESSLAIIYNIT